jgi:beta-galactosidase/beta-glucuronidase
MPTKIPDLCKKTHIVKSHLTLVGFVLCCAAAPAADWKPAAGPLFTRFAKDVSPEKAHPEYPRPQMVRDEWQNLNGLWDYAIRPRDDAQPKQFDGKILVPFPVESALSGVMQRVGPEKRLWYRRQVTVPDAWRGKRILLHFEAVDWEAVVSIDGQAVRTHKGGYAPFTIEVTDWLAPGKPHEIVVSVWDPSDAGTQPCGKQHNQPEGIYYTPSTGIWQTVWLEPVPQNFLKDVRFVPDAAGRKVTLTATLGFRSQGAVAAEVSLPQGRKVSGVAALDELTLEIPQEAVQLWTPDSPFLYSVEIRLEKWPGGAGHQVLDRVTSYFALRSVGIAQGTDKNTRIVLNGKPIFLIGPLDQGFWPDGLYTAPTDEALKSDIEVTKKLGFNLIRKHVKVEPARWYYWCDKLGIAVLQDMPSGDAHISERAKGPREIRRSAQSVYDFDTELMDLIDARRAFGCIVGWVPFNEGWGQFDTVRLAKWVKDYDPSRLVDPASGWTDFPVGDVHDTHDYPGPSAPPANEGRASVLGEFGGLGLPIPGHLWVNTKKNWGYRKYTNRDALTAAYLALATKLRPLVESRLSAAVYTQTTDCETEVNGLMTYDRELIKMDAAKVREANTALIRLLDKPASTASVSGVSVSTPRP